MSAKSAGINRTEGASGHNLEVKEEELGTDRVRRKPQKHLGQELQAKKDILYNVAEGLRELWGKSN